MSKFEEVEARNELRRQRLLEGKYNCIPFPFKRLRKLFPGFVQGRYYLITANQKIGKSKLADFLFIYEPLFFMMEHPELKVKIKYFSLEMSATEKYNEFLCHLLFRLDKIRISPSEMESISKPRDPKIGALLRTEKYQKYIQAYDEMVDTNDTTKNPTGINKECRDYAVSHGHMNYIPYEVVNDITGEIETKQAIDPIKPYTQDDPDEYRIIILDNAANLSSEKGLNKAETIEKMSKYGITLAKQLNYIFVFVQHQAQAQEGVENIKIGRMRPTADGLGDCKTTSRDLHCMIGLYNPIKFLKETKQEVYEGYNIRRLGKYCRFLEIIDDRHSNAGGSICPLFFDGAISMFKELPLPTDSEALESYYKYTEKLNMLEQREDLELTNPK